MRANNGQTLSVNVLISCMYQNDTGIIEKTNIQTDVVVVNQCDMDSVSEFDFTNKAGKTCHAKIISTTERGLSRSRNMAIENSWGDVCLICDDDEELDDDYENKIVETYIKHPEKDAILFIVKRNDIPGGKKYPEREGKVNYKQILQSSSVQISFKRASIFRSKIKFDILLGSGSGNGGGEENKFLIDVRKQGLIIYYVPVDIGVVKPGKSLWFKGFDKQYMKNQGWSSRRSLGTIIGFFYSIVFWARHFKMIRKDMPVFKSLIYIMQGFFEKRNDLV